jgi:hypothetical protein
MKKAKVILSAIVVFAVVGGALAFNAKKTTVSYYTCNTQTELCTVPHTALQVSLTSKPAPFIEVTAGPSTILNDACGTTTCQRNIWIDPEN